MSTDVEVGSVAEILAFCRARLDDTERLAWDVNAHDGGGPERWWLLDEPVNPNPPMNGNVHVYGYFMCVHLDMVRPNMARYVVHHCPERVLASVKADRAILDGIESAVFWTTKEPQKSVVQTLCGHIVRYMAARDADHPDYRTDWSQK